MGQNAPSGRAHRAARLEVVAAPALRRNSRTNARWRRRSRTWGGVSSSGDREKPFRGQVKAIGRCVMDRAGHRDRVRGGGDATRLVGEAGRHPGERGWDGGDIPFGDEEAPLRDRDGTLGDGATVSRLGHGVCGEGDGGRRSGDRVCDPVDPGRRSRDRASRIETGGFWPERRLGWVEIRFRRVVTDHQALEEDPGGAVKQA